MNPIPLFLKVFSTKSELGFEILKVSGAHIIRKSLRWFILVLAGKQTEQIVFLEQLEEHDKCFKLHRPISELKICLKY